MTTASEIFLERIFLALESTRGTAVTTPTHSFNMMGLLTPDQDYFEPEESRGELRAHYRARTSRKGAAWTLSGAADPNYLTVLLNMAVKAVTSPSTPSGATNSRLWTFTPSMTADDLKSASLIWSLEAQNLIADYAMIDTLTLENGADGTEGLMCTVSGACGFPSDIAAPSPPANITGDLLVGQLMQLWIDTSSAIGTTAITARLLKAKHEIKTGVTYKHWAAGPTASLDFSGTGRDKKVARCITTLTLEVPDMAEYDIWAENTVAKCRVRHNGSLIETTTGPVNWYNYVEVDTYGIFRNLRWGENQGSNRTLELTIESHKDTTLGADFRVAVQSARTSL